MKRIPWNKGLNKYNNKTMAIIAEKVKKSYDKKRRKEYSDKLKEKYKNGDILTPEKRRKVILCGSKAWANKVKNASLEERKKILFNFITAGNNAQKERRKHLTPEDYQRLYPFAKGIAKYYNCDNCGKKVIKWFGGKKRSNKRFCCRKCYTDFLRKNPSYGINNKKQILFYSKKMLCHFKLLSSLEKYIANILEESNLEYEIYSNIKPNPTIENVQNGVNAYKKSNADYIIAIGGGSSIDTAKAIGIIINNPEFEDVRSLEGVAPTKNKCVPIIAVPTTAGTAPSSLSPAGKIILP